VDHLLTYPRLVDQWRRVNQDERLHRPRRRDGTRGTRGRESIGALVPPRRHEP
jgi:hypothetical protein